MIRVVLVFAFLVLLASCSTTKNQSQIASPSSQSSLASTDPELMRCQQLFEQTCQRCHKLPDPASRSEVKWEKIIPVMAAKAKIDLQTQDSIHKYILVSRMASK